MGVNGVKMGPMVCMEIRVLFIAYCVILLLFHASIPLMRANGGFPHPPPTFPIFFRLFPAEKWGGDLLVGGIGWLPVSGPPREDCHSPGFVALPLSIPRRRAKMANDYDLEILAYMTNKYSSGTIHRVVHSTLNDRRVKRLNQRALTAEVWHSLPPGLQGSGVQPCGVDGTVDRMLVGPGRRVLVVTGGCASETGSFRHGHWCPPLS